MEWLKTIAPTVASALLGPMAGLAVTGLADVFGLSNATKDKVLECVTNAQMDSNQLVKIKELEAQLKAQEEELQFKFVDIEFKDRDSARNREIQTKDSTNKILAYVVVGSFIAVIGATLLGYAQIESVLAGTLVGYLSAKAEQVLAYYFGSTSNSARKTELLAQSSPANPNG